MQAARFLIGQAGELMLWASFDEQARFLQGRVTDRRFAAYCAPYRSEDEARQALIEAGALQIEAEPGRKPRRG